MNDIAAAPANRLMAASTEPSRLLGIPRELRLIIYEFIFPANETWTHFNVTKDLAVLSVCKITRAEALPIYFDHAGFSFYFDLAMGFVTDNADSVFRNPGLGQFKHMRKLGLCFEVTNEMELDEVRSVIEFVVTAVNGTERMRMVHLTIYWVSVTKQCTLDAVIGAFSGLSWAGKLKMSYLRIALGRDADLNLSGYHKKVSRAGG